MKFVVALKSDVLLYSLILVVIYDVKRGHLRVLKSFLRNPPPLSIVDQVHSQKIEANFHIQTMSQDRSVGVVIDESNQKTELTVTPSEIEAMLKVMEDTILPITEEGVRKGNKVFGAAILDKDLKNVIAGTNAETECPLFHGEVKCIYEWSKIVPPSERGGAASSSVFLATHEPCCMCISSILWSGFQNVFYFFPYEITKDQGIPHDINTMHELWGVNTYRKQNKYLSTCCLMSAIESLEESEEKATLQATAKRLLDSYDVLSKKYHSEKAENPDNSLVLG